MQAAVEAYHSRVSNASANASSLSALNATALDSTGIPSIGFFSTVVTGLGLLDPQILIRLVMRAVMHVIVTPIVNGEPVKWERAFLFAPFPRPPSLLSDVEAVASATKVPVIDNALVDVLEGQLICLAIVAAFILVFLIREWVINQQPLLNMPDEEQADNPAPAQQQNEQRQGARHRRRALRHAIDNQEQLQNRPHLPVDRPRAQPRPRRRATDDNLVAQGHAAGIDRPALPQRAASLVPALEELEVNIRQLQDTSRVEAVESPPLERGVFDEVGQIQRTLEESRTALPPTNVATTAGEGSDDLSKYVLAGGASALSPDRDPEPAGAIPLSGPSEFSQNEFTFRAPQSLPNSESTQQGDGGDLVGTGDDDWVSEPSSEDSAAPTPLGSSSSDSHHSTDTQAMHDGAEESDRVDAEEATEGDLDETTQQSQNEQDGEPDTIVTRISKWLWHTDDFVPGTPVPTDHDDETEIVANIDTPAHLAPDPAQDAAEQQNLPQPLQPNIQNGVNINDPNAVDEAEDLEGILELIGMEGPIAGMIQNIIFSVFLITLTLSASVWCPYIWGKIALLFIAHPFSVFFKAPLYLLSRTADFIVDVGLFSVGMLGVILNYFTTAIRSIIALVAPGVAKLLDTNVLETYSFTLSQNSGIRLEKMVTRTLLGFRPDLPTFSIQSHHVLRVFTKTARDTSTKLASVIASSYARTNDTVVWHDIFIAPVHIGAQIQSLPANLKILVAELQNWLSQLQQDLRPVSFSKPEAIDYSLVQWTSTEKIACIIMGYMLFAAAGSLYLKVARWQLGLKSDHKVPGFLADTLTQAGGVMKVIVIIGIEMIAFPLYCGTMLDIALLPMFEGATLYTRLQFFRAAPFTALFIHWFIGTCYMFHFALFVSMCRKVMRKGVLYFIRDPDDPSFHPVRDVLERPVATQLGKIAFSAFVYGSLLVICLGGVVTGLNRFANILPIRWGALDPTMIVPGDIIFYNFMLPVMLRKIDLSAKVSEIFDWWFRACAAGLRLTDFLFGIDSEEEKQPGAFLWRRFFKLMFLGEDTPKHPMVKYVEELANDRERLVWFETKEGIADDDTVRKVFPNTQFKIINLVGDKSQALIHFEEGTSIVGIKAALDTESSKTDSKFSVRKIKDMKVENVELPNLRKTPVDSAAGSYVRAPAKDSARVPKGTNVFVRVDENNKRLDDQEDSDLGLHGRKDERFSRIFTPNHFKARISTFIGLVWLFAALAGLAFSVGPLVVGRVIMRLLAPSKDPVSDLYALTAGVHAFAAFIYLGHLLQGYWARGISHSHSLFRNAQRALPRLLSLGKQALGVLYLLLGVGFVAPMALSLLAELYINIPAYMYLMSFNAVASGKSSPNLLISSTQGPRSSPVVHVLQTWALGLVYLRAVIHLLTNAPNTDTRPAAAIRAITRNGMLKPDVRLASRALLLPILVVSFLLIGLPPGLARIVLAFSPKQLSAEQSVTVYRYSYPCLLFGVILTYLLVRVQSRVETWRVKIRDEVYVRGEQLHNFPDPQEGKKENKHRKRDSQADAKGKRTATAANFQRKTEAVSNGRRVNASVSDMSRSETEDMRPVEQSEADRRAGEGWFDADLEDPGTATLEFQGVADPSNIGDIGSIISGQGHS